MDFFYINRDESSKLSATKLTKALIRTNKRCKKYNCDCRYEKLKFFFPDNLDKDITLNLIKQLQKHYLVV